MQERSGSPSCVALLIFLFVLFVFIRVHSWFSSSSSSSHSRLFVFIRGSPHLCLYRCLSVEHEKDAASDRYPQAGIEKIAGNSEFRQPSTDPSPMDFPPRCTFRKPHARRVYNAALHAVTKVHFPICLPIPPRAPPSCSPVSG